MKAKTRINLLFVLLTCRMKVPRMPVMVPCNLWWWQASYNGYKSSRIEWSIYTVTVQRVLW